MSIPAEKWKTWEGKIIDGKIPLRQCIGTSDHSAVFLTERGEGSSQKAAIKVIPGEHLSADAQLSRWAAASRLSHPHLIRLFEHGRCQMDGGTFCYVVMEYADENLAEIVPVRALSTAEALEVLRPAADALAFLHESGFVHSRIKPSNIMALGNELKLSSDGLRRINEPYGAPYTDRIRDEYGAPELANGVFSAAADLWSLGLTLVTVITQREPTVSSVDRQVLVPPTIPQPFRGIAQQCLQIDPAKRPSARDIQRQLSPQARVPHVKLKSDVREKSAAKDFSLRRLQRRPLIPAVIILFAVIALIIAAWIVRRNHTAPEHSQARQENLQPASPDSSRTQVPASPESSRGSVLHQAMPDVSASALHTITGHIKVAVEVAVDPSGSVSSAKLASRGPSEYFAARALAAARECKFTPPRANGQAVGSEWQLLFQFGRSSTQVFPKELKP